MVAWVEHDIAHEGQLEEVRLIPLRDGPIGDAPVGEHIGSVFIPSSNDAIHVYAHGAR